MTYLLCIHLVQWSRSNEQISVERCVATLVPFISIKVGTVSFRFHFSLSGDVDSFSFFFSNALQNLKFPFRLHLLYVVECWGEFGMQLSPDIEFLCNNRLQVGWSLFAFFRFSFIKIYYICNGSGFLPEKIIDNDFINVDACVQS